MTDHNAAHQTDRQGLLLLAAITRAAEAHPQHADTFMHAAPLLAPTSDLLCNGLPQLYETHVAELLDRIAAGDDLTLPTAAELLVACADMSLRAPLNRRGFALYAALFHAVLPGHSLASAGDGGDGADSADLRATLTRAMQRQIGRGPIRGTRQIAAWRVEAGLPRRRARTKAEVDV